MASKFPIISIPAPGFEDVCASEAGRLLGVHASAGAGIVSFSVDTLLQACDYIYRAQTPSRVALELFSFKPAKGLAKAVTAQLAKVSLKDWLPEDATFVVRADLDIEGRQELEAELGETIYESTKAKVDLKRPDVTFLVVVRGAYGAFGIDLSGDDLGKRDYRIFLGPDALKGHVAASLVLLSGYAPGQLFLDPFCRSGVIPIEATLLATRRSPHHFGKEKFLFRRLPALKQTDWDAFFAKIDKDVSGDATNILAMDPSFNNVSAAKKNAKIAGVIKQLTFSRTDLEFLDAKFGKHAVDTLVTLPPQPAQDMPELRVDSMMKDVFYQAEFVMKKNGTVVIICRTGADTIKKYAQEYKFTLKNERKARQGKAELTVLTFQR
ncbi:hypothetical protein HY493_03990 [Candidatus Woesearchaeota archaeon]|nr:hypothetical protein [Candidatus Woesearchaeota archaeon]